MADRRTKGTFGTNDENSCGQTVTSQLAALALTLVAAMLVVPARSSKADADVARVEAARRRIADCDARLAKYRAALEAGADPATVAGWMAEVKGERLAAEEALGVADPGAEQLTRGQVRALVAGLKDILAALAQADPKLKAELYAELGVELTYFPGENRVLVEAQPGRCTRVRVEGGNTTMSTWPTMRGELDLVA